MRQESLRQEPKAAPVPPAAPTVRPQVERPAAPAPAAGSAADKNLAEMAQRLEAALRRPGGNANTDRGGAPPVVPEAPASRARAAEPAPAPSEDKPAEAPKTQFKNLEDEMASLLGRPKNPT